MEIRLSNISRQLLRDIPNWKNAPVPVCMGGDARGLTFCCKPGEPLTFGWKCLRDQMLEKITMTAQEFIELKDDFSHIHYWSAPETCFGSLSYCCMRQGGCTRRDSALHRIYPDLSSQEIMARYFELKRKLAQKIIEKAKIKIIK